MYRFSSIFLTVKLQLAACHFSGLLVLFWGRSPEARLAKNRRARVPIGIITLATLAHGPQDVINKWFICGQGQLFTSLFS
jgi:hypothetical protein